mmetsp:Transcript_8316/g.23940  ORF Transcript_8316/g.23940 Transcript_8316/m.23940 type:complete len:554 (+) Transcript_8316:79-1740(+)
MNYSTMATSTAPPAAPAAPEKLDVKTLVEPMAKLHESGENQSYEWRMQQLLRMREFLSANREAMKRALYEDMRRCDVEACNGDLNNIDQQLSLFIRNLRKWMKPKQMPSPLAMIPGFSRIEYRPLQGPAVFIIAASNFPIFLCFQPAIGALAAGNPVVIKTSELCPACSELLEREMPKFFPPEVARIVAGGVPETTALLQQPWGKIVFTGSERVGRIVAQAAAKTLTPVILELGGKCPAYVSEDVPSNMIRNVADRLVFSKIINGGQVCVAPDTVIVHQKHAKALSQELVHSLERQLGKDPSTSDLTRMIIAPHAQRLIDCLNELEDLQKKKNHPTTEILFGGSKTCNVKEKYVCPTLVLNPPSEWRLMKEEIFGPIMPIVTVASRDDAIDYIRNTMPGTPLALYVFTSKESVFEEMTKKCPSATAFRNDSLVHLANQNTPMCGLGSSGYGRYLGHASFQSFSHEKPTFYRPLGRWADLNNIRYRPYRRFKQALLPRITLLPDIPVIPWTALGCIVLTVSVVSSSSEIAQYARHGIADNLEAAASQIVQYLRS